MKITVELRVDPVPQGSPYWSWQITDDIPGLGPSHSQRIPITGREQFDLLRAIFQRAEHEARERLLPWVER